MTIGWFFWDPPREAFSIPYFNHPIVWYGILFVLGFIFGYYILIPMFSHTLRRINQIASCDILDWDALIRNIPNTSIHLPKDSSKQAIIDAINQSNIARDQLTTLFPGAIATVRQTAFFLIDRLCWYFVAGTIIGARLGYVFFYDWAHFQANPLLIFKTWEGGLASHGAIIGLLIALFLYRWRISRWYPAIGFLQLLDICCIPAALAGFFIRIGNLMNQEILGTPTTLPWGVVFGHPADGSAPQPRHPVQLYEGLAYLFLFVLLMWVWKTRGDRLKPGRISGIMITLVFAARFVLEFFKAQQESVIGDSALQMGQYLSIPFIIVGLYLIFYSRNNKKEIDKQLNK